VDDSVVSLWRLLLPCFWPLGFALLLLLAVFDAHHSSPYALVSDTDEVAVLSTMHTSAALRAAVVLTCLAVVNAVLAATWKRYNPLLATRPRARRVVVGTALLVTCVITLISWLLSTDHRVVIDTNHGTVTTAQRDVAGEWTTSTSVGLADITLIEYQRWETENGRKSAVWVLLAGGRWVELSTGSVDDQREIAARVSLTASTDVRCVEYRDDGDVVEDNCLGSLRAQLSDRAAGK
jgi:hypothetical protein